MDPTKTAEHFNHELRVTRMLGHRHTDNGAG